MFGWLRRRPKNYGPREDIGKQLEDCSFKLCLVHLNLETKFKKTSPWEAGISDEEKAKIFHGHAREYIKQNYPDIYILGDLVIDRVIATAVKFARIEAQKRV
ncbi:hypothetical protein JDN40_05505 [Rhodomicrobium vannielii ATCC 17100]|uniref:hypothetical protein n=1 Tax=Rhodomicrobium vannielii TaxID=1069 RepID=UPI001917A6B5|nr:hypothetical protein [Rhodomicrobium vannielii]MBJ7533559.1 hypothetical protein [Rhodomicrobium vannielii ATCC 17100]